MSVVSQRRESDVSFIGALRRLRDPLVIFAVSVQDPLVSQYGRGGTPVRGVSQAEWKAGRLVSAMDRAPAVWLVGIVGLSTIVRAALGLTVPSVWILPDEIVYSELAKSIAAGGWPAIRGVHVFGWGEIYPALIAPAWALFDDPVRAYHITLGINALVMSLAAIPAYLLARMFVSQRSALLVALFTVLVPSMSYTGVVMTENACYPAFLLSCC